MNKHKKRFTNYDVLVTLKKLVEKATPKKPKLNNRYNDQGLYLCPKCNNDLEDDFDYCPNCGQAIKWEED